MNFRKTHLSAGLYFVATPIGSARDITLRALDVLASADILVAEDTRTAKKLMEIHGVGIEGRSLMSYHDHSGNKVVSKILSEIEGGKSVAYFSEAGTPLVADPGFELGKAVAEAGFLVTSAPGPSAPLAALTISGLASDRFAFVGFLPAAKQQRLTAIAELRDLPMTLIIFESPKRLRDLLSDLCEVLGEGREAAVCRELTKKFEEVVRGRLNEVSVAFEDRKVLGECVVVVGRAGSVEVTSAEIDAALTRALENMRVKDAATTVAGALGLPRKDVYQRALQMKGEK